MRKFLNILLLLIAFALNESVVNAKNSTGQGSSCKEFMMTMMDGGDGIGLGEGPIQGSWGPNDEFAYSLYIREWSSGIPSPELTVTVNQQWDYSFHFTTDGTNPTITTKPEQYAQLQSPGTMKTIVVKNGNLVSDDIYSFTLYKVSDDNGGKFGVTYSVISGGGGSQDVAAPTFGNTAYNCNADYGGYIVFYITNNETGAKIYYSENDNSGTVPTTELTTYNSSGYYLSKYATSPAFSNNKYTLKVVAKKDSKNSSVATKEFSKTTDPTVSLSGTTLSIPNDYNGFVYKVGDGSWVSAIGTTSATLGSDPAVGTKIKVRAYKTGCLFSNEVEYTVSGADKPNKPTINQKLQYSRSSDKGLINFVTITCNNGSTVHYTTNGVNPTSSAATVDSNNQFTISTYDISGNSLKVKAVAIDGASNSSDVAEYTFYKTDQPTYTDNGNSITINIPSGKTVAVKNGSWTNYNSNTTISKDQFSNIIVSAYDNSNGTTLFSDPLNFEVSSDIAPSITHNQSANQVTISGQGTIKYSTDNKSSWTTVSNGSTTLNIPVNGSLTVYAYSTSTSSNTITTSNIVGGTTYNYVAPAQKPATPTISINHGFEINAADGDGYTISNTLSFTESTLGATIYYTTDGTDPKNSSTRQTVSNGQVVIGLDNNYSNVTRIRAVAELSGTYSDGEATMDKANTPVLAPNGTTLSITQNDANTYIFYHGDGVDTWTCMKYDRYINNYTNIAPVYVVAATAEKLLSNPVAYGTQSTATPTITFDANAGKVTAMSADGVGASNIYYTTDGNDPNTGSSTWASASSNGVTLSSGATIKVMAQAEGKSASSVVSFTNSNLPSISCSNNIISYSNTSGYTLEYSTDGTNYNGNPINSITETITIYVRATGSDGKVTVLTRQECTYVKKSATPIIKYLEDYTADPNRKYIIVEQPSTNATYSGARYTTDGTTPSETNGTATTSEGNYPRVVTTNPTNGTTYKVIAKEQDESTYNCSYSDPVSFTYNSANIPAISCVDNTVTISNPNSLYTIYYTKNQADNSFHYADDSSTRYTGGFTIDENSIVCIYAVPTGIADYVVEVKQLCEYGTPASDIWTPTGSGAKTGTFTWIQKATHDDHVINLNFGDAIKTGNALYFNCSAITAGSTWNVEFEYGSGQWTSIDNGNVKYSSGGHNVYYDEWLRDNSIQKSSLTGNVRIRVTSSTVGTMTISDAGIIQYPTVNTTQKCVETGYTDCYLTTFTPFDFLDATIAGFRGGNYNYLTGAFSRTDANNSYFEIPVSGLKVKDIKRLVLSYSDPNQTVGDIVLALRNSNGGDIVKPYVSDWENNITDNTINETDISRIRIVLVAKNGSEKPLNFTINNLKMYLNGGGILPTSGTWDYGSWQQGSNGSNTIIQIYGTSAKLLRYTVSDTRGQNEPTASSGTVTINQNSVDIPVSTLTDGTHYIQLYAVDYSNPPLPLGVYTWKVTKSGNSYTYEYLGKNEDTPTPTITVSANWEENGWEDDGETPLSNIFTITAPGYEDGTIYYTTDGTEPTTGSTEYDSYSKPQLDVDDFYALTSTYTIKALAVAEGKENLTFSQTFTKTANPTMEQGTTTGKYGKVTGDNTNGFVWKQIGQSDDTHDELWHKNTANPQDNIGYGNELHARTREDGKLISNTGVWPMIPDDNHITSYWQSIFPDLVNLYEMGDENEELFNVPGELYQGIVQTKTTYAQIAKAEYSFDDGATYTTAQIIKSDNATDNSNMFIIPGEELNGKTSLKARLTFESGDIRESVYHNGSSIKLLAPIVEYATDGGEDENEIGLNVYLDDDEDAGSHVLLSNDGGETWFIPSDDGWYYGLDPIENDHVFLSVSTIFGSDTPDWSKVRVALFDTYTYKLLSDIVSVTVVELSDEFELINGNPDYDDHFLITGEAGSVVHYTFKYEDSSLGGMATITSGTVTLANDGTGSISLNTINVPIAFNSSNPLILEVASEKNGQTSPTATYQFVRSAVANQGQSGNTIHFEVLDGDADGLEYFYQYFDYTQDAFIWSEKKTDINFTFDFTVATSPKSISTISKQPGKLKASTQSLDILQFEKPDAPTISYDEGTVTISTDETGTTQFPVYLIYTTDGSAPSVNVGEDGAPSVTNGTSVQANSTNFSITSTTTIKAIVYCANTGKYHTFISDQSTETFTIGAEWEPYGRGTFTDEYFFRNGTTMDIYVRTSTKEGESNIKQIKVANWESGWEVDHNVETGYSPEFIFNWNTETGVCTVSEYYTGIYITYPTNGENHYYFIEPTTGSANGSYDSYTDTYSINFTYYQNSKKDKTGGSGTQNANATLKMEGMWLGDMTEDESDDSAVQDSYMPQLSQYKVGLVKIPTDGEGTDYLEFDEDGVCRIVLDDADEDDDYEDDFDTFFNSINNSTERHWLATNATNQLIENSSDVYKMLDQFNFSADDEGAYYIVVARQVPNGDGTYSYTGAYQYMPVYYSPASNWEVVGARTYKDDVVGGSLHYKDPNNVDTYIGPTTYKVLVEENINTPGLFRVKNMYLYQDEGLSYDPTFWWYTYQGEDAGRKNVYFYVDATNADSVKLFPNEFYAQPLGVDYGYGEMMLVNLGNGVYEDGHIKFKNDRIEDGEDGWDGMLYEWEDCRQNGYEYDGTYVFNWKYTNADINPVNRFYLQISLPYPLYDDTPYTVDDMTAVNDDDEDSNYEWTIPNGGRHLDVTYDRILSNVWGTVMLPCKFEASDLKLMVDGIEYSEDAGFNLYELVGQVGSQLKFSLLDSQMAEANSPVIFKYQGELPDDATLCIDIKDTKVVAVSHVTEPTVYRNSQFYVVNCNDWELLGTYTPVAITDNEHENDMKSGGSQLERDGYEVITDYPLDQSYFIHGNKVNQVDGGIRVRQYRSFLYDATSSGIKSFSVFFDDEKPNAADSVNYRPINQHRGRVNLAGQRVDEKFRGIVIEGGRKKLVR